MVRTLSIFIAQLASLASLIGLYLSVLPLHAHRPNWHWLLLVTGLVLALFVSITEARDHWRSLPKSFKRNRDIKAYMKRWISSGGRAVIFCRDLSWADTDDVRSILRAKAKNAELTLCIEKPTEFAEELESRGAAIVTYGELGHIPRSRFTIMDYERDGARVAIGTRQNGGTHQIQEFRTGAHPCFALSDDLVKILLAATAKCL